MDLAPSKPAPKWWTSSSSIPSAPGSISACPIGELTEEVFDEGFGFDGSSIRGWKSIEASDMLAMPDPATAFIDPFCAVPTSQSDLHHRRDRHQGSLQPRSARHRPARREISAIAPAWPTPPSSGRKRSSSSSTTCSSTPRATARSTSIDSEEAHLEHRARRDAQPGLQDPPQGRLFPGGARRTPSRTSAPRCA